VDLARRQRWDFNRSRNEYGDISRSRYSHFGEYTLRLTATATGNLTPKFVFSRGVCEVYINGVYSSSITSNVEATIAVINGDSVEYRFTDWQSVTTIDTHSDKVSGDISGWVLPSTLQYLSVYSTSVSGDISGWVLPSTLQYLYVYSTSVSGDISGWTLPSSLATLAVNSTSVSGDISGWTLPSSLATLSVSTTSVSGDISGWTLPSTLVSFYVSATSVSGDISGWVLPSSLVILYVNNTSVTYGTGNAFDGITSSLTKIDFDNCSLLWNDVDRVLQDCVDSGVTGKTLDLAGTNAAPSAAGEANKTTLVTGRSWTVSTTA